MTPDRILFSEYDNYYKYSSTLDEPNLSHAISSILKSQAFDSTNPHVSDVSSNDMQTSHTKDAICPYSNCEYMTTSMPLSSTLPSLLDASDASLFPQFKDTPPHTPQKDNFFVEIPKLASTMLPSTTKRSKCPSYALKSRNLDYPSVVARRKSTIHAACKDLRDLLGLPEGTSKIDTLQYVIQLITIHKNSFPDI